MAQVGKRAYERLEAAPWGAGREEGASARIADALRLREVPRAALVAIAVLTVVAVGLGAVLFGRLNSGMLIERGAAPVEGAAADGEAVPASEGGAAGEGGDGAEPDSAQAQSTPDPELRVHVAGAVAVPGVYSLPEGARVLDAVEAAGGLAPNADAGPLNLAEPLADGCKVTVPAVGEAAAAQTVEAPGATTGSGTGDGGVPATVNINTADEEALQELPGVGEAIAAEIVRDRAQNGPFASPEDLMRVSGIGEKKFERMRDMVVV